MSSFYKKAKTGKRGGVLRLALLIIAVILVLSYLGITYTDIAQSDFFQFFINLFSNFFR